MLNDELIKNVRHEFDINFAEFNYDPKKNAQSVPGFAGLHNLPSDLSAILVQLFYLIPFRFFVLTRQIDNDEWLNDLQVLFTKLIATRERHVDAQAFRDALHVSSHEQQDPCDFLNDFLNRLPESVLSIFKGGHVTTSMTELCCALRSSADWGHDTSLAVPPITPTTAETNMQLTVF
jgi:hypothetical protein